MLRVPDKRARNLLDLAYLIENVEPSAFSMKSWQTCICGHYLKAKGQSYIASNDWENAAASLGLTDRQATELFAPYAIGDPVERGIILEQTPSQAAERIRKFAFALMDRLD